jgi:hypothetical protein
MATKFHAHDAMVREIGPAVVRAHFQQSPQGLYAWRIRGIPYTHRGAFAQLASIHGVAVPSDFLAPPARLVA